MDVSSLIASFATGSYVVTRRMRGTVVKGRVSAGATSQLTITAAVHPASGRDLMRVAEGRRSIESRVLFTGTPLVIGNQGSGHEADLVQIDGVSWEVQHIETWRDPSTGAIGYRAIVQATA